MFRNTAVFSGHKVLLAFFRMKGYPDYSPMSWSSVYQGDFSSLPDHWGTGILHLQVIGVGTCRSLLSSLYPSFPFSPGIFRLEDLSAGTVIDDQKIMLRDKGEFWPETSVHRHLCVGDEGIWDEDLRFHIYASIIGGNNRLPPIGVVDPGGDIVAKFAAYGIFYVGLNVIIKKGRLVKGLFLAVIPAVPSLTVKIISDVRLQGGDLIPADLMGEVLLGYG